MAISRTLANRLGFIVLGLANNFAYVIMLSAAYDLLKQSETQTNESTSPTNTQTTTNSTKYCNEQSTSTILLADTIPSLTTKLIYPLLLVQVPASYKAIATALLSAGSFLVTGLFTSQLLIFTGVALASFSSGLGESTFLSHTPRYGDTALSGWSIGTGAAGLFGAISYAVLRMLLSIKFIMILMLVVPIAMMFAYFVVIEPTSSNSANTSSTGSDDSEQPSSLSVISRRSNDPINPNGTQVANYGIGEQRTSQDEITLIRDFDLKAKFYYLPTLSKYFLPLLLVYFAEYFINQGLFELVYYPEVTFLDHGAQYRWFQVSYQLGVMISRSSLDFVQIKSLWSMSLLQSANAILFLLHASKLINIPSFYLVILLIVYEGLLGGFTYANTFYRMKREVSPDKSEFAISTVTIADTLGIVFAGMAALPVHNALCKLYE